MAEGQPKSKPRKPRGPFETLHLAGREVTITNPEKVFFPQLGITKLALVQYYVAVADGALRGVARRPQIMKRFVDGVDKEPFYQKRVDKNRPPWVETATFTFPSGRHAEEIVVNDVAQLAYVVNLGCVDLNPHAVRREDMERPDELRIDLDPVPGVQWPQEFLEVGKVVRDVLAAYDLVGWPKTSGSRGAHIWIRIHPRWEFAVVRRAAQAFAREVEALAPAIATARWSKEERHGVFLDYNQNARDRTTASAYSVRAVPDARVSMPLSWDEFLACDPRDYTFATVPPRVAAQGDAHAAIDDAPGVIDKLLELADRQDRDAKAAPAPKGAAKAAKKATKVPVITIARAKQKPDALAGLERWKARHAAIVPLLAPEHVIVDTNRGRATAWYRVRINLRNVPEEQRPSHEPPDPDYDWKTEEFGDWLAPASSDPSDPVDDT